MIHRLKVVALVRNPAVTQNAYGSYVTPIPGNIGEALLSSLISGIMCFCMSIATVLQKIAKQRGQCIILFRKSRVD